MSQSVIGESPELIESLINMNKSSRATINRFIDETRFLRRQLKNSPGNVTEICRGLHRGFSEDPLFTRAREMRNSLIEAREGCL